MPFAMTIDQRRSRSADDDLVDYWVEELNDEFADSLVLPFVATVGDELQGLTDDPAIAVELVLRGVQDERWWVGLGIGDVEQPLKATAARSRGNAFYRAREAVDLAKKERWGFAVESADDVLTAQAVSALQLLAFIVQSRGSGPRSENTWQAVQMRRAGTSLGDIAEVLGITHEAVRQRVLRAGYEEEMQGRDLACELLQQAERVSH